MHVKEKLRSQTWGTETTKGIAEKEAVTTPQTLKCLPGAMSTQWKLKIETQHRLSVGRRVTRYRKGGRRGENTPDPLLFLLPVLRAWHWLNITRSQGPGQPWKCCSWIPELRWGRVRNGSESSLAMGGTHHPSHSYWEHGQGSPRSFFTWM